MGTFHPSPSKLFKSRWDTVVDSCFTRCCICLFSRYDIEKFVFFGSHTQANVEILDPEKLFQHFSIARFYQINMCNISIWNSKHTD